MNVAFLVLQATGIALVFTQGSIFEPFRRHGPKLWRELAACPLCSGTWIGMIMAAFAVNQGHLVLVEGSPTVGDVFPYVLGIGCITAISALTFKRVWDLLESAAFRLDALTGSEPLDGPEPSGDDDRAS